MKKILTSLILSVIILTSCATKEVAQVAEKKIIKVTTAVAKKSEITREKSFSGAMQAYQEANLGALLPGRVEKIYVEVGDQVQEGDLIAELSGELLTQAEIEYKTLEKDFNRMERLLQKEAVSQIDFDHIKAKYEAAEAKYQMIKKSTEIRAFFPGIVADIYVNEGENYLFTPALDLGYSHTPGIVKIINMDNLKIEIAVNEKDLQNIFIGQKAIIKCDANDEEFTAKVTEISPIVEHTTRSCKVELTLPNDDHKLKPGMFANVKLQYKPTEMILVPRRAISRQSGTGVSFVYIANGDIAKRRNIEIVYDLGDVVAVNNLDENTEIIVEGKTKIFDGDQIQK
jgi:membrane fusion protein (multidrug efflux system)